MVEREREKEEEKVRGETPIETGLIPRTVVTDLVARRDAALTAYNRYFSAVESAAEHLREAEEQIALACLGTDTRLYTDSHQPELVEFHAACKLPDFERVKRVARRLVDLRVWAAVIEKTELRRLMDRTAKREMRQQMAYVPEIVDRRGGKVINEAEIQRQLPPVTEDNVLSTIETLREEAGEIFQRGVAVAFSELDSRFRSHDGFKIGSRMILSRVFDEWGSFSYFREGEYTLLDVERVFLVLDGKAPPGEGQGGGQGQGKREGEGERGKAPQTSANPYRSIVDAIKEERRGRFGPHQSTHESDYFKVCIYINGNAHLWFKRDDLVEKVNRLLADYYGAAMGWGRYEDEDERADPEAPFEGAVERKPAKRYGLFPTPDGLAERVFEASGLDMSDWSVEREFGSTSVTVLEPSAGTGQLARRAAERGHRVTVVEIQPELAADLRGGPYSRVVCRDFLKVDPETMVAFDVVLMNPPFDRFRDVDHVRHALKFLRPGGRLVAIMSASARYGQGRKATAFRETVRGYGGKWTDLPEGSFKECGTNVNTEMLVLTKNRKVES